MWKFFTQECEGDLIQKKWTPVPSVRSPLRSHRMRPLTEDESRQENTGGPPPIRSPSRAVA
jgi:hypothetical protein